MIIRNLESLSLERAHFQNFIRDNHILYISLKYKYTMNEFLKSFLKRKIE